MALLCGVTRPFCKPQLTCEFSPSSPRKFLLVQPIRMFRRAFGLRPFLQHIPFHRRCPCHHRSTIGVVIGQFDPVPAWIKEIDRMEDRVVGDPQNLDPVCLKMLFIFHQRVAVFYQKRQMLHPDRCVLITPHFRLGWQFKKRQNITVTGIQKHMHVRIRFVG